MSLNYNTENVNVSFRCNDNCLRSLRGCPEYIDGNFYCHNNFLKSLKYGPVHVSKHFDCRGNSSIKLLKYYPLYVGKDFRCDNLVATFKDIPYEILSKIPSSDHKNKIKRVSIPVEFMDEFLNFYKSMAYRSQIKKRNSIKERLNSI